MSIWLNSLKSGYTHPAGPHPSPIYLTRSPGASVRIAFVSANREKLPDAVIPLGVLSVVASIPDHHETTLIDLCFERYPLPTLQEKLRAIDPAVIAVGMRNIQNAAYTGLDDQLNYYAELLASIREVCTVPIVLGGSGFSVMPRELMERLRPDYGISGEGEKAFPQLLAAIEAGGEGLDAVGNLHRVVNGEVLTNPAPAAFFDLHQMPKLDRTLLDSRYYERYRIESIQTKRGCPLRCEYCTYPIIEGRIGRTREPSAVVDEMFQAMEVHPEICHFFIVDSVFNLPRTHAKEVCKEMIARDWSVPWSCYTNPLGFDTEMAELASAAGCTGMEVGSDSGCDHVLKRLRKGFTTDHIRRLHDICESTGVKDCHTFILGTEGETTDDVERSVEFIVDLDPFAAIVMIWIDDYEALDPVLRKQRLKFREQIEARLYDLKDEFPYWIIPPLGVNFSKTLFRRVRRDGNHGPLWEHVRDLIPVPEALARSSRSDTDKRPLNLPSD
ncbi:MAG TPA: radical SAM protein [Myxococcales bacterium]|nr:radical SAM protein [Myxococcales bacterium]